MHAQRLIPAFLLMLLVGCTATMHPDYQKTYFKQQVSSQQIDEVMRRFGSQGLTDAKITIDTLGKIRLAGSYENEKDVALAFSIARDVVGENAVSNVRPDSIKQKDWEVSASKGIAKFIEELAKKYKMSVNVEQSEENNLIGIFDAGLDGMTQFDPNSSVPTANATQFYQQMAAGIAKTPSEKNGKKRILIVGHTDDMGVSRHNVILSEQRAHAIGKIFESAGISSDRIYYQGAGESLPVADNRSENGRAKNRRVEIVDIASDEKFAEYLKSRTPNVEYYRPRQNTVQLAHTGGNEPVVFDSAGKVAQKKRNAKKQNGSVPAGISNDAEQAQEGASSGKKVTTSQVGNKFANIDFGGNPSSNDNNKEIIASFGELVEIRPALFARVSSFFVNEAQAKPEKIYSVSCLKDSPRYGGDVTSLKTGKVFDYHTSEYWPGLYQTSWVSVVNGNYVGLTPVGVLRDSVKPVSSPDMLVYIGKEQPGNVKADFKSRMMVQTYQGTGGVLYRFYPDAKDTQSSLVCGDIVFPNKAPFAGRSGRMYYRKAGQIYSAEFKPKML